jgi:dolichol kinase
MMISDLTEGLDRQSIALMVFEGLFVPWLMLDKKNLTPFAARKLCHAGSGVVMMLLNCEVLLCRIFVYLVALVSLCMNWEVVPRLLANFWFGQPRDKGITLYLVLVVSWVYLGLPLRMLAPVFLADPAGAVVGKWMSAQFPKENKKWIGSKTIFGSLAVFCVTFLTLFSPVEPAARVGVALLATVGEAIGGPYDNLVIALVVIAFSGLGILPFSPSIAV